ncbi:4'-phosphopantetheinyl transferase [Marinobacter sp. R17]|uniref:4'-phosphopantetheinyl transferase family protein n=1 Tax=Marinobacter sp. R17 TaxID=2484250 RepID=UPI001CC1E355|nr:4'-phosphopantetheinyl transferase superfamily protein [Marinobacter sp. R17]
MKTSLPLCCSNLDDGWPWRQPLPGLQLISLDFDPDQLRPGDFRDCEILPPAAVQRARGKRQTEYLAGRLCAREALQRLTGEGIVPETGHDRAPRWPADCVGSITHSQGKAAAIVGARQHYAGVGLDLEITMTDARARKLAGQILTADEHTRAADAMAAAPGLCLTRIFSLKESLFKALYPITGQRFYFEHAEVLETPSEGHSRLRLLKSLSDDWPAGAVIDAQYTEHDDHILSLIAIPAGPAPTP